MEIGHFIKNIRIKKNMAQETLSKNIISSQKIKEDLSSDRKIISLYLEFKIRFKNNKLILPLTTKEIRSIYDYLVASPIYTINDYTILALLVKIAPIPMIEHLHSKMFPVEFRELRNQAITDVILCFYFNITSELIQLQ